MIGIALSAYFGSQWAILHRALIVERRKGPWPCTYDVRTGGVPKKEDYYKGRGGWANLDVNVIFIILLTIALLVMRNGWVGVCS